VHRRGLVALLAALAWAALPPPAGAARDALRVCADPDNLPFSSEGPGDRGLYVELAELVAARLQVRTEYTWWRTYFGRRSVRSTLLADRCDVFFGLPADGGFMGRSLAMTAPFLDVGYAIITSPALSFSRPAELRHRRVAVAFASLPQLLLAQRGFQAVTYREEEQALEALGRGDVDAAFVWGPKAGYYNLTRLGGQHRVVPIGGEGLQWRAAVAVRKADEPLRQRLEKTLGELGPDIRALAVKYGFPSAAPIPLDAQPPGSGASSVHNPFRDDAAALAAGKSLFNQRCAHCHGPNAFNPEPSRDLRRLRIRHGDARAQIFFATVAGGRPAAGMPVWGDQLDADAIWKMWVFVESVQLE
jgi:polar amino acid transport system substrate-binding protein